MKRTGNSGAAMIHMLGVAQICSWGTLYYAFPLIAEAMGGELGWSKDALYGAASLGLALSGLAAYPIGAAIDAGHGRMVMTLASLAAGILFLAWSQLSSLWAFYAVFGGIGCLQAATLYDPAFAVVARRFGPLNARRAITQLTLWGGFASTVFVPLIQWLIDGFGWRGALVALAATNIVPCAGLYFAAIDPRRDHVEAAPAASPDERGRGAVREAMRMPVFWALALAFVCYATASSALTFHFYPLLLERGLAAGAVVLVFSVIGPAQVAGRMVVWLLAGNAPVGRIGSLVVIAFPLSILGFAYAPPEILPLVLTAAVYGAANGMMTIVRGLSVPEMVSRKAYGAINGAITTPMRFVQALAPVAVAWLWTFGGNYDLAIAAIFAMTALLAVGFWTAALIARGRPA
jgi:MFS family permease